MSKKKLEDVVTDATAITERKRVVIPFSPRMDIGLGGGIMEGTLTILTGKEKLGKTIGALTLAANAQKEENGGRKVFYHNIMASKPSLPLLKIRELLELTHYGLRG